MNVEIAQRLAALRREQGYSQEELAEKIGLSRQAVSKWERAESSPDTGNLVALAKLYGVSLDELLSIDDEIEDDIKFESQDKAASAETKARAAADQATAAAEQAAAAANLATLVAKKTEEQASKTAPMPTPVVTSPPNTQSPPPPSNSAPTASGAQVHFQAPPPPHNAHAATAPPQPAPPVPTYTSTRGPWKTFPYPVVCVIIFLFLGFFMGMWHPGWIVFLTIPLYYWMAHIIESDPVYRQNHTDAKPRITNTPKDGE